MPNWFPHVRVMIEEGRPIDAQALLRRIQPLSEYEQNLYSYALACCAVLQRSWDEATQYVLPLLETPIYQELRIVESTLERERYAQALMRLGQAALTLALEKDATSYLQACLKVLHDRRVHLPDVRIRARLYLAMSCRQRGLLKESLTHCELALKACRQYRSTLELPYIYYELTMSYYELHLDRKVAEAGERALFLAREVRHWRLCVQITHLVGSYFLQQQELITASEWFHALHSHARQLRQSVFSVRASLALTNIALAQDQFSAARCHLRDALQGLKQGEILHLRGLIYLATAQLTLKEIGGSAAEGMFWYEQALDYLSAGSSEQAEALTELGRLYEHQGRQQEALLCWRQAYQVLATGMPPLRLPLSVREESPESHTTVLEQRLQML